jgi:signal transduction histidine kinase
VSISRFGVRGRLRSDFGLGFVLPISELMMTETESRSLKRSLAATLALVWVGFAFYGVLNQLSGMVTLNEFEPQLGRFLFDMTLLYWLPWILFAPVLAAASERIPIRPDNWVRSLPAHAALLMVIALAHGLSVGYLYHHSGGATGAMAQYAAWQHAGHYLFGDGMLLFDVVAYAVFAASLNIRHFHHVVRQQQLDASELKHRLAEQRLQTLRMQINPHFLFNALNAISVLVKKGDNERAGDMIKLLSSFFRRTLDSSDQHWVPLEEELDFVRQYLAIAQLRFGDRLQVSEQCDPQVRATLVPALLLQPLVENAVTHGLADKTGSCAIELLCRADEHGQLTIEIADNGVGGRFFTDPSFKPGIGLASVRSRLEQLYGREQTFEVNSTPGQGTRIRIRIPIAPTRRAEAI